MLFYTLTIRHNSYAESLYQRGLGLTLLQENSRCRSYVSMNCALMIVVVSTPALPTTVATTITATASTTAEPERCRGHVMYPVARDDEVDRLFAQAVAAGAMALMGPRRTAMGHYSAYLNDGGGYLWEITSNVHLLDPE